VQSSHVIYPTGKPMAPHLQRYQGLGLITTTAPLAPLAASPCPSAIGYASGECRVGLAGGRA